MLKFIIRGFGGMWVGLGFYRGYENSDDKSKLKAIGYGFCGMIIYLNPLAVPLILEAEYKNIKRK